MDGVLFEKRKFQFRVTHGDKHDPLGGVVGAGNAAFLMSAALDGEKDLQELEIGEAQLREATTGDRLRWSHQQRKNVAIEYKVTRVE